MDVEQPASREDALELVLHELVHAGAAGHDHRLDVEVVERVRDAMEQHAVRSRDRLAPVVIAGGGLRITAAEVARRQHHLRADVPEHRLRGEPHLREQPLRAAAGEVEHRLLLVRGTRRIADDGDDRIVLDVEERPRGALRQAARHRLVEEVHHLLGHRRRPDRRRRPLGLRARDADARGDLVAQPLRTEAPVDHQPLRGADRRRIRRVEEEHRRRGAGPPLLLAGASQQVAHGDRHVAEVDVDRAGVGALVADGAVIGDVPELVEVAQRDAAARLLLVEEGLDQQARREDLVARAVEQVGARHVRRAHRLALAAAQAVLDRVGDPADRALLEDQALGAEQREARRVRIGEIGGSRGTAQQLAGVEAPLRIDAALVVGERREFRIGQELELGDADAVLARDDAAQRPCEAHDPLHRRVGVLEHPVVVGVHRDVGVHVAVAGMHVHRDEQPPPQHLAVDRVDARKERREREPGERLLERGLAARPSTTPRASGPATQGRSRRGGRRGPASGRAPRARARAPPRPWTRGAPAAAAPRCPVPRRETGAARRGTRRSRRRARACSRASARR